MWRGLACGPQHPRSPKDPAAWTKGSMGRHNEIDKKRSERAKLSLKGRGQQSPFELPLPIKAPHHRSLIDTLIERHVSGEESEHKHELAESPPNIAGTAQEHPGSFPLFSKEILRGPKRLHTHVLFGKKLPITQDICYTGNLLHSSCWQELFCVIRVPPNGTFCDDNYTEESLGIHFPIAHTSFTQTNYFRIICVIISGLIALEAQRVVSFTILIYCRNAPCAGTIIYGGLSAECKFGSCLSKQLSF